MPLNTYAPTIFSRIAQAHLFFTPGWTSVVKDVSDEITGDVGDSLQRPDFETAITISDYSRTGAAPTDQTLDDEARNLLLNRHKSANIVLEDIDLRQRFAALFAEAARNTGQALAVQMNTDLRNAFDAPIVLASGGANETVDLSALTIGKKSANEGANTASLGGANGREILIESLIGMAAKADLLGWSPTDRFMVIHPFIKSMIVRWLLIDKGVIGQGQVNDRAYVDNAIANTVGWEPVMDKDIAANTDPASGSVTDQLEMFFGIKQDSLEFASQMRAVESERVQGKIATRVKSLLVYGAQVFDNDKRLKMGFQIAQTAQNTVPVTP